MPRVRARYVSAAGDSRAAVCGDGRGGLGAGAAGAVSETVVTCPSPAGSGAASRLPAGPLEVDDEHLFLELRAARDQRAVRTDDEAVPVEHQLVLAADGVAEREAAALASAAGGKQAFPLLALLAVVR